MGQWENSLHAETQILLGKTIVPSKTFSNISGPPSGGQYHSIKLVKKRACASSLEITSLLENSTN